RPYPLRLRSIVMRSQRFQRCSICRFSPPSRSARTRPASVVMTIKPETAATRTSRLPSRMAHNLIGNTSVRASARNSDTGTLSNEDRNATKQLAKMPRWIRGNVMRRNVYQRLAPRLREQFTSCGSSCCSDAPTMRITNGTQTTICPSTSVAIDNLMPTRLKTISSESPNAMGGRTRGDMKSASGMRARGCRLRATPSAPAVRRTAAPKVASVATLRLVMAGWIISADWSSSRYQRIDQLGGGNFNVIPPVKEMINTTAVGARRSNMVMPASGPARPAERRSGKQSFIDASHETPGQTADQYDNADHRHGEYQRQSSRERPVLHAHGLLIDVEGH